ncbi:hypothetical protein Ciccas_002264 [Cichlidogyrus casuarinus]|uniref:SUN domain-containing protein n=1 Tax=Cichlidogyrus casuarinus TaxID=1844966 RepID=A0ABD2QHR3_9PLAT
MRLEFIKIVEQIPPSNPVQADLSELDLAIAKAIERYDADKTGLADYALGSAGASVVSIRCTETYTGGAATFRFFGIPLASFANSPATVLQPGTLPGHCWAFKGSQGSVIIKLAVPVHVTSVSVEHIARRLVYSNRLDSAPRDFRVLALPTPDTDQDDASVVNLGNFSFDAMGPSIQFFTTVEKAPLKVRYLEFQFLNNHGHPSYTCIYRLRVHGNFHEL